MNAVEDRLREALSERAAHSPIAPDAWERTVARSRRRRWTRVGAWSRTNVWSRVLIPAAAAAAVVAVVIGVTVLTGRLGQPAGPGRSPVASAAPTPPPPPGRNDYSMQSAPPVTEVVRIKLIVDGQTTWTFVWFGYLKSDRAEGLVLCTVTDGDGYGGGGGCGPENVPARQVGYSTGPYGSITMGTSIKPVTSVSARLANGRTVPGVVVSGRGFPYKFWAVVRPADQDAQIIFRGAGGAELGHLAMAAVYNTPSRPRRGGIVVFRLPADAKSPFTGTMTAYLFDGRGIGIRGKVVGFWDSNNGSLISNVAASGPPAVVNLGGDYGQHAQQAEFFGYAHQNVARVVLRLADGRQYGGQTFAAWPGSGLRLWAFAVPTRFLIAADQRQDVMTGYDAAGHVVWQQRLGASA